MPMEASCGRNVVMAQCQETQETENRLQNPQPTGILSYAVHHLVLAQTSQVDESLCVAMGVVTIVSVLACRAGSLM